MSFKQGEQYNDNTAMLTFPMKEDFDASSLSDTVPVLMWHRCGTYPTALICAGTKDRCPKNISNPLGFAYAGPSGETLPVDEDETLRCTALHLISQEESAVRGRKHIHTHTHTHTH